MTRIAEIPVVRRVAIALVALSLFAGITAALTYDDTSIPANGARLTAADGALVTHADGKTAKVKGTTELRAGDIVEATGGPINVELPDGSTLEGRSATRDMAATKVQIAAPVGLLAGPLLVVSDKGTAIDAAGNIVRLSVARGVAARIERGLAVSAAAYNGRLDVDSAGQERTVLALRQLDISVLGRPPSVPRAIELNPADPWDLRFLGGAMETGRTLDALSRTFSGSHATLTAAQLTTALPMLSGESALSTVYDQRCTDKAGETLVGAAIAGLGTKADFPTRWHSVFDFRCGADAGGAGWGVVALDQAVAGDRLIATVEQALGGGAAQLTAALPPPGGGAAPQATTPTTAGTASSTTSTPAPTTEPTVPPDITVPPILPPITVPPILPPLPQPQGSTGVPLLDGLINTVGTLLGGLIGGG